MATEPLGLRECIDNTLKELYGQREQGITEIFDYDLAGHKVMYNVENAIARYEEMKRKLDEEWYE